MGVLELVAGAFIVCIPALVIADAIDERSDTRE
jgi:hypothetical protein